MKKWHLKRAVVIAAVVSSIFFVSAGTGAALTATYFADIFGQTKVVQEVGSMSASTDPNWWLSSGADWYLTSGGSKTIQGDLPAGDPWRLAYAQSNPEDTDNGYHPQNIFRLPLRSKWLNYKQTAYFKINRYNLSASSNRNASNGLFFFNRYQDQYNLYYTGLRVDGAVVIKKKYKGVYYTMAYKKIYPGTYDGNANPILLPRQAWIGLRSVVKTNPDNSVTVKIYIDYGKTGKWSQVLSATDTDTKYGDYTISNSGYAGIRTDFMDAEFSNYSIVAGLY